MSEKILIPYHDAAEKIRDAIDEGKVLQKRTIKFSIDLDIAKKDFDVWNQNNEKLLLRIFNTDEEVKKYKGNDSLILRERFYLFDKAKDFHDLVDSKIRSLESILGRLTIVTGIDIEHHDDIFEPLPADNKVLIFKGLKRNRDSVEKLIKNQGFEAVIPKNKKTDIDEFEGVRDVDFAVAFVTNGDLGATKTKKDKLMPRAAQDSIFELGFLIGKLGRERVTILLEKDVELPGHLNSISCIRLDNNGWRDKLTKKLREI